MALIFMDSFDHYANNTTEILRKWDQLNTVDIDVGFGRRGTNAIRVFAELIKTVPAQTTYIVGMAVNHFNFGSGSVMRFFEGATLHCSISQTGQGALVVNRGVSTVLGQTPGGALRSNAYNYIEAQVTIGDAGRVILRADGVEILDLDPVDTRVGGVGNIDGIGIGNGNLDIDDLYILDTTGSAPRNTFLGDCEATALEGDGDGNYTEFTTTFPASPTDHFSKVDDTADQDDDASYNESAVVGHRDSFTLQNLPALPGGSTVFGVQAVAIAKKDDSGARSLRLFKRISATDSVKPDRALSTEYTGYIELWETDLVGAGEWSDAIINGMEIGYEVRS